MWRKGLRIAQLFALLILMCLSISDTNASGSYWITKLSQNGQDFNAYAVTATGDGGVVYAGGRFDSKVAWVIKKDSLGNTVWKFSFSGIYYANFHTAEEMSDGSILIAGANSHNGVVGGEAWVMKLSQSGQLIYHALLRSGSYGYVNDIVPTSDGGAVLTGYTYSSGRSDDVWLVKINSGGGIVWQKYYDSGNRSDAGDFLAAASDGYYIIGWVTIAPTIQESLLMKVDLNGNLLWSKALTGDFDARGIAVTGDGLVVSGDNNLGQTVLSKFNLSGQAVWVRMYEFGGYDEGNSPQIVGGNIVLATGSSGNIVKIAYSNGDFVSGTHIQGSSIRSLDVSNSGDIYLAGFIGSAAMVASVNSSGTIPGCSLCGPVIPPSIASYNTTVVDPGMVSYTSSAAAFSYSLNTLTWPLTEEVVCVGGTGYYTVSGQVIDAAGNAIIYEWVKLEQNGNVVATESTDGDGNYTFSNVAPGQYYINLNDVRFLFNPPGANITVTGNVVRNFQAVWPAPFLDLPLNYDGRGTGASAFQQAYLRFTNSVLDHYYPNVATNGIFYSYTGGTLGDIGYDGHTGYDFSASRTDKVILAPASGMVILNAFGCLGNTVRIHHLNGFVTTYAHLAERPNLPQYINAGDQIGIMGNTYDPNCGMSSGAHLHFEVEYNERKFDPSGWLSASADPWASHAAGVASRHMWKYTLPDIQSWLVNGSSGAVLVASAGTYEFSIPAGAFGGTKTFGFVETPVGDAEIGSLQATGYAFDFGEGTPGAVRNPEINFNYTIKISYEQNHITDFSEDSLELFYWDDPSNAWVDLNATVNIAQNTLSVVTNRQGVFALFGETRGNVVFLPMLTSAENQVPTAPTNLTATAVSSSQIDVYWEDNSQIEDVYELWWMPTNGGVWTIYTYPPNTTFADLLYLSCNTQYFLVVRAVRFVGSNIYYSESNSVYETTPGCQ